VLALDVTKPERIAAAIEAVWIQTAGSFSRRDEGSNPSKGARATLYNAYGYPNQIKLTFHGVSETDSHRMKTVSETTCPDKRPLGLPIRLIAYQEAFRVDNRGGWLPASLLRNEFSYSALGLESEPADRRFRRSAECDHPSQ